MKSEQILSLKGEQIKTVQLGKRGRTVIMAINCHDGSSMIMTGHDATVQAETGARNVVAVCEHCRNVIDPLCLLCPHCGGSLNQPSAPASNETTSRQAARKIKPVSPRKRVLFLLTTAGAEGMTDDEMQVRLEMKAQTETSARRALVQRGLIEETDMTRKTRAGNAAIVWIVVKRAIVRNCQD